MYECVLRISSTRHYWMTREINKMKKNAHTQNVGDVIFLSFLRRTVLQCLLAQKVIKRFWCRIGPPMDGCLLLYYFILYIYYICTCVVQQFDASIVCSHSQESPSPSVMSVVAHTMDWSTKLVSILISCHWIYVIRYWKIAFGMWP